MKKIFVRLSKLSFCFLLFSLLSACEIFPATPLPIPPPATLLPTTTVALTPAATLEPYAAFLRDLQNAIEKSDEASLKNLLTPVWISARYRSEGTQYRNVDDALAALRSIRQGATITLDLNRAVYEPTWAQKFGERVIMARWQTGDGREEYAHLYLNRVNNAWRWAALLTGIPYYHSPNLSMIRLDPARYVGREVMIVGEYRGANNDKELKDAAPNAKTAFTLKDASGGVIWIAASFFPGQELPLKPTDPTSISKPVRVIGTVQYQGGRPFIASDSASVVAPDSYLARNGILKDVNRNTRILTLDNDTIIALSPTTSIDFSDTRAATLDDLQNSQRLLALGRLTTNNALFAEQIFIQLPPTPTATPIPPTPIPSPTARPTATPIPSPTPKPTPTATPVPASPTALPTPALANGLMFTRFGSTYIRDLRTANETLLTDGNATQWDWTRDGARAVFVKNGEIWTIQRNSNGIQKLMDGNAPQWNADGTLIVFERNLQWDSHKRFKLKGEVWTMNADGTGARKLNDGYDPAWSPDGGNRARIAFASNPTGSGGDWLSYRQNAIRLMNAQGLNVWTPLSTNTSSPKFTPMEWSMAQARLLDSPQWSPDGRELTVRVANGHGAYVTADSFNSGFGKFIALYFDDLARGFSYSPDGAHIALGSGGLSGWETINIYRRSAVGRDGVSGTPLRTLGRIPRQQTDVGQTITSYAWSPEGKRIAYTYLTYPNNDQSQPPVPAGVWIMDITTGATKQINTEGVGPVAWLP